VCWISALNNGGESMKNRKYLLKFQPNSKSVPVPS
jgi:hypothetical protein